MLEAEDALVISGRPRWDEADGEEERLDAELNDQRDRRG
jgi:hypothetical protein